MLENSNFHFGGGGEIYSCRRRRNILGGGGEIYSTLLWFKSWAAASGRNLSTAVSDFANCPIWIAFKTQDLDFQQKTFSKAWRSGQISPTSLHNSKSSLNAMSWVKLKERKIDDDLFFKSSIWGAQTQPWLEPPIMIGSIMDITLNTLVSFWSLTLSDVQMVTKIIWECDADVLNKKAKIEINLFLPPRIMRFDNKGSFAAAALSRP